MQQTHIVVLGGGYSGVMAAGRLAAKLHGKPGDTILIKATDDFMVASVTVEIYDRDGSFIEGGNATANEKGTEWTYTTTTGSNNFYGNKVTVKAMDMPANLSEKVQMITLV